MSVPHPCCRPTADPRELEFWRASTGFFGQLQVKVLRWRYQTHWGMVWAGVNFLGNLFVGVSFVMVQYSEDIIVVHNEFEVETVNQSTIGWARNSWFVLAWIFLLELLIQYAAAPQKLHFLVKWSGLVPMPTPRLLDLVSIATLMVYFFEAGEHEDFRYNATVGASFRMYFCCASTRFVYGLLDLIRGGIKSRSVAMFYRKVIQTASAVVAIVFIGSALFMHIENWSDERDPKLEYFTCVYFVIVTMTTVGYGDISPTSNLSMGFTIVLMLFLITTLYPMIMKIVTLMSSITSYNSGSVIYRDPPVIVCCPRELPFNLIRALCLELFHPDQPYKVSVTIISQEKPSHDVEFYLWQTEKTDYMVHFIQGDIKDDRTLTRAGVQYATACIVVADPNARTQELGRQDQEACMMALRLRRYTHARCKAEGMNTSPLRVIMQLHVVVHMDYFTGSFYGSSPDPLTAAVVGLRAWQQQSLAKSITAPGFTTMFSNLASRTSRARVKKHDVELVTWMDEYMHGGEMDLYSIKIPGRLAAVPTAQISAHVYKKTGCCLIPPSLIALDAAQHGDIEQLLDQLQPDQIRESAPKLELSRLSQGGALPTPLSESAEQFIEVHFNRVGFRRQYGDLHDFSARHHMADPRDRPALVQELGSAALAGLADHILVYTPHVVHISHFVRVLRVATAPLMPICIVTPGGLSDAMDIILSSFNLPAAPVVVVRTALPPGHDMVDGVLRKCGLERAKHVVISSASQDLEVSCMSMLVRGVNPSAVLTTELNDFRDARDILRGDNEINAWTPGNQEDFSHAVTCNLWDQRTEFENRAAVCAS
eukprot:TRINITY_DN16472_c0_g1_i13.p1 TRINITY_DN16472_c0_g1~~TRINITY_DN16472_c0_g1_i13.p1  ORF type:complete len:822 (-),score=181.35 TRINITY_DN16472_c0_g1_i13:278-2743(-)